MTKEENKEMEELSLKLFGKKYAWKRIKKRGLGLGPQGRGVIGRRHALTVDGIKQYMVKTLEMQEKIKQDMEKKDGE